MYQLNQLLYLLQSFITFMSSIQCNFEMRIWCSHFDFLHKLYRRYLFSGMCSFSWIFAKFLWAPDFVEFVFGSFSCFNIEIVYSNFSFCGAWTPRVHMKNVQISAKRAHPWNTILCGILNLIDQFIESVSKMFFPSFIASVQVASRDSFVMLDELGNGIWAAWDVGVNIHLADDYSCYHREK